MLGVGGDGVERAVGADIVRLVDVERDRPRRRALPGDQRLDLEIFARQHFEIVERARHHGADDRPRRRRPCAKPSSSSNWWSHTAYWSAVRRGSVAIRQRVRDLAAVDQREDEIGVSGVDGEQHGARLSRCARELASMFSRATDVAGADDRGSPSSVRRRSAPSGSRPSNVPLTLSPSLPWTVSGVPTGCARASHAWANSAGVDCAPQREQPGEARGEQRREGLRASLRRRAMRGPALVERRARRRD